MMNYLSLIFAICFAIVLSACDSSGVCLCGFPELHCTVDGEPGPACDAPADCESWCTSGLPTCAPHPWMFPPECGDEDGCFFVEESCSGL